MHLNAFGSTLVTHVFVRGLGASWVLLEPLGSSWSLLGPQAALAASQAALAAQAAQAPIHASQAALDASNSASQDPPRPPWPALARLGGSPDRLQTVIASSFRDSQTVMFLWIFTAFALYQVLLGSPPCASAHPWRTAAHLAPIFGDLGPSSAGLRPSSAVLGPSWAILGPF